MAVIGSIVTSIGSGILGFGAQGIMGTLTQWIANGAVWFLDRLGGVISETSAPYLGAGWFVSHYHVMKELGVLCILPTLLISTVQAVISQDLSRLGRTVLVSVPLAILATAVTIEGTQFALSLVDNMSKAISTGSGGHLRSLFGSLERWMESPTTSVGGPAVPAFVGFILACVVAFAGLILWIELVIRTSAIYVIVLFVPLALVGSVNGYISHWSRKVFETLGALIISKLVIVATLSLGVSAISNPGPNDPSGIVVGVSLVLLAAFAPYGVLKLVPMTHDGIVSHLEGLSKRGLSSVAAVPKKAVGLATGAGTTIGMVMDFKDSLGGLDRLGGSSGGSITSSLSNFSPGSHRRSGPGSAPSWGDPQDPDRTGSKNNQSNPVGQDGLRWAEANGTNKAAEKLLENWNQDGGSGI